MSGKTRTGTQRKSRRSRRSTPEWRPVRWQWRRPHLLEVTRSVTTLPAVAVVAGYVPDGGPSLGVAIALAVHTVADLATRCIRRTRE